MRSKCRSVLHSMKTSVEEIEKRAQIYGEEISPSQLLKDFGFRSEHVDALAISSRTARSHGSRSETPRLCQTSVLSTTTELFVRPFSFFSSSPLSLSLSQHVSTLFHILALPSLPRTRNNAVDERQTLLARTFVRLFDPVPSHSRTRTTSEGFT